MRQMESMVEAATIARLQQRRQELEVAVPGLEGLVTCPFCLCSVVMEDGAGGRDPRLRIPQCGRSSSRRCREAPHRPLACHQVEGTPWKVEEQLTLAMIRRCWKCSNKVPHFTAYIVSSSSSRRRGATG